jgi:hypothetical protein
MEPSRNTPRRALSPPRPSSPASTRAPRHTSSGTRYIDGAYRERLPVPARVPQVGHDLAAGAARRWITIRPPPDRITRPAGARSRREVDLSQAAAEGPGHRPAPTRRPPPPLRMARPRVGQGISLSLHIPNASINFGCHRSGRMAAGVFVTRSITFDDRRLIQTLRRSSHRAGSEARRAAQDGVVAKDRSRHLRQPRTRSRWACVSVTWSSTSRLTRFCV